MIVSVKGIPIELPNKTRARKVSAEQMSYLMFVAKKVRQSLLNAECDSQSFEGLRGIRSVVEYFGGAGFTSAVIQSRFQPDMHLVFDKAPECFIHLRRQFGSRGVRVYKMDSFMAMARPCKADLVCIDFNAFTLNTLYKPLYYRALEKVFAKNPKYVLITDCAVYRMRLNWRSYRKFGQIGKTPESYFNAFSTTFWKHFNYTVRRVVYQPNAARILLSLKGSKTADVVKIKNPGKEIYVKDV